MKKKNKKKQKVKKLVITDIFIKSLNKTMGTNIKSTKKFLSFEELKKEIEEEEKKWSYKYIHYPFWYILDKIKSIPQQIKWFFQRRMRGFDDLEWWNLCIYLKEWLTPRLEIFIKNREKNKNFCGYPPDLTNTKWNNILNKILWWAKNSENEQDKILPEDIKQWKKFYKKEKEARELFAKYFNYLWD